MCKVLVRVLRLYFMKRPLKALSHHLNWWRCTLLMMEKQNLHWKSIWHSLRPDAIQTEDKKYCLLSKSDFSVIFVQFSGFSFCFLATRLLNEPTCIWETLPGDIEIKSAKLHCYLGFSPKCGQIQSRVIFLRWYDNVNQNKQPNWRIGYDLYWHTNKVER